jgi:hypothetical protein
LSIAVAEGHQKTPKHVARGVPTFPKSNPTVLLHPDKSKAKAKAISDIDTKKLSVLDMPSVYRTTPQGLRNSKPTEANQFFGTGVPEPCISDSNYR